MVATSGTGQRRQPGRLLAGLIGAGASALVLIMIGALLVATGSVSWGGTKRFESSGFATPEAAIQAYLNAMKRSDVDAMIGTFAVETYVDRFDLEAYVRRMGAYPASPGKWFPAGPVNDSFTRYQRLGGIEQEIACQYQTLSNSGINASEMIATPDDAAVKSVMDRLRASLDGSAFADVGSAELVELAQALPNLAATLENPHMATTMEASRTFLGADELAERLVRLETPSGGYFLFIEVYRYGDKWFVGSLNGTLSSLAGIGFCSGGLQKV